MSSKAIIGVIGISVLVIVGLAVLLSPTEGNIESVSPATGQDNLAAPAATTGAELAPDFQLKRLGGGTLSLSQYRSEKAVILDFFATWCPNCRRNMPKLSSIYEKYKDDVEVVGVNLHEDEGTVQSYIKSQNILYPIVLDPASSAANTYGVFYTNYHVFINRSGVIVNSVPGDVSEQQVIDLISSE
ncbi:MAG: redoxin domain-containing protein [Candidatus Dojkabacteria bacterium]